MKITRKQDEVVAKLNQLAAKEASLTLRDLMALDEARDRLFHLDDPLGVCISWRTLPARTIFIFCLNKYESYMSYIVSSSYTLRSQFLLKPTFETSSSIFP